MDSSSLRVDHSVERRQQDLTNGTGMNTSRTDARLTELKRRVAAGEYAVDASLVADEIHDKMRLVTTVRRQLVEQADRVPIARPRPQRRREAWHQRRESGATARYVA
jgi:hypothetical protein